jgi:hypothetical protein
MPGIDSRYLQLSESRPAVGSSFRQEAPANIREFVRDLYAAGWVAR